MIVLIDTNVMLDYLAKRDSYFQNADSIIRMCISNRITGYIAAHSVMNSFYILRKAYSAEERREMLKWFIKIVSVVGIDELIIRRALLRENFDDFEDCLQDECAVNCAADYIITRNIADYHESKVEAITPEDFLKLEILV